MLRFIDSGSLLTQFHTSEIPAGQYEEFYIYAAGTNAGGATLALANLNNIRVNRNGNDFINVNVDNLSALSDLLLGMVDFASAIGAAFNFGFHIPCYVGEKSQFPNVLQVSNEDNVKFHFDWGNLAAIVAAGTWYLYGKPASGLEEYLPVMVQDSVALAAAGAREKRKTSINNVYTVFAFPSVAANYASDQLERDGEVVHDSLYAAGAAYTNNSRQKEATAIAVMEMKAAIGLRPDELLSETLYVYPLSQTGAVTIEYVYQGAIFDTKAQGDSIITRDSRVTSNLNRKRAAGKPIGIRSVAA